MLLPAVLLPAVLGLAGCTDSAPSGREVDAGQVEEVARTAFGPDHSVEVALPSGLLSLGVAVDVDPDAGDAPDDVDLGPASGVVLVGVTSSWEGQPSSEARDVLANGASADSLPRPTVRLVDGDDEIAVPVETSPGSSGAVVVGAEDPTALSVTYDGQTQTVDLATGTVDAGQAAGLEDLGQATTSLLRTCPARDFPRDAVLDHACQVETTHRLPWVRGLGWAPDGQVWLVVDVRVTGSAQVRIGDLPGTELEGAPEGLQRVAFPVAPGAPHTVGFDFGPPVGLVSVPLGD